jgi:hypothetical protein
LDRYSIQYSDGLHLTTKEKFIIRELFITFALNYFDASNINELLNKSLQKIIEAETDSTAMYK